ncbi:hypothetical protein Acsp06_20750 [Actinomycetospora sp. NBRC 106375]|uniref:EVE domain-containing protein n=1 Tax=Actinomycetospora sp. NBRC 106375 TaxID=3032207 RepID=UPI0024A2C673|nr:EVE domain-containing protein [Actinomycetospora sp. NBRC 106375]GLZ45890.1 hypothetical protein Acsp06_20750 [Actinomycetospora sp. NBRC 106375]
MTGTDERQYWVWVAAPDRYGTEDGGEHPDLDPASGGTWWSCHRDTRAGDLAVLYRSREAKDIAYRLRAVGDAYELPEVERPGPGQTHACAVEVLDRFVRPVPLADLKADPVVAEWPALKSSFSRGAAAVPPDVWARLMELAEVSEVFGGELSAIAAEELAAEELAAELAVADVAAEIAADEPALPAWGSKPDLAATARRPTPQTMAIGLGAVGVVVVAGAVVWGVRRRR